MNIEQICEEFLYGVKCRKEAVHINRQNLSAKFERSHKTIAYIVNGGQPPDVCDWEAGLIRKLVSEHKRLLSEASARSQHRLAAKYGVSRHRIQSQLEFMDYPIERQA